MSKAISAGIPLQMSSDIPDETYVNGQLRSLVLKANKKSCRVILRTQVNLYKMWGKIKYKKKYFAFTFEYIAKENIVRNVERCKKTTRPPNSMPLNYIWLPIGTKKDNAIYPNSDQVLLYDAIKSDSNLMGLELIKHLPRKRSIRRVVIGRVEYIFIYRKNRSLITESITDISKRVLKDNYGTIDSSN